MTDTQINNLIYLTIAKTEVITENLITSVFDRAHLIELECKIRQKTESKVESEELGTTNGSSLIMTRSRSRSIPSHPIPIISPSIFDPDMQVLMNQKSRALNELQETKEQCHEYVQTTFGMETKSITAFILGK